MKQLCYVVQLPKARLTDVFSFVFSPPQRAVTISKLKNRQFVYRVADRGCLIGSFSDSCQKLFLMPDNTHVYTWYTCKRIHCNCDVCDVSSLFVSNQIEMLLHVGKTGEFERSLCSVVLFFICFFKTSFIYQQGLLWFFFWNCYIEIIFDLKLKINVWCQWEYPKIN